jgi:hypothetical protein
MKVIFRVRISPKLLHPWSFLCGVIVKGMSSLIKLTGSGYLPIEEIPMDPITAALSAFAEFNKFLCTPAGQKLATDSLEVITNLLKDIHSHIQPKVVPTPTPAPVPAK